MVSNNLKVYVPVDVEFREDGTMLPRIIVWEDGTKYPAGCGYEGRGPR